MALDASIKIDDREVSAAVERLRLALPLGGDMTPAMKGIGRVLKTGAQLRFRSGKSPDGRSWQQSHRAREEGGQTLSLTRRLRNSITYRAEHDSVEVGTNVVYAAIHQFGGIIRAKNGPFLAIPITPEARAAGSPRNMPNLVVTQSIKGQFMLVDKDSGTVHYLLKKQVKIPARPFLGASDDDRTELLRIMDEHLSRAWQHR